MKKIKTLLTEQNSKMTKLDYLIASIIVVLYAILSFINLGSMTNPQTFYTLKKDESLVFKLANETDLLKVKFYNGDNSGKFAVYSSIDNDDYDYLTTLETSGAFSWDEYRLPTTAKYLKLVPTTKSTIGEIAFYDNYRNKVAIKEITTSTKKIKSLTDEPKTIPKEISYLNSSYFDEIYFARTAYNYKEKMETYEWTHPPLGKMLQALPVIVFDNMSPFFYRLMGNLAGIMMIYIMYLFGKLLFKTRKWAIVASLLMFFDTLHFTQTRLGTVDSFLVLFIMLALYFMYRYIITDKKTINLFLSGLFFSLSISVKWTAMLSGLALAIIYFTNFFKEKYSPKKMFLQGLSFFVVLPLLIYIGIYLIYPNNRVAYTNSIPEIITLTEKMYDYHSTLKSDHYFSSPWYSWPVSYKPVWYYTKDYSSATKGTISALGNIFIWWGGIIAVFASIFILIIKKDRNIFLLLIPILSLWLPYIFIGRVMFLYHYFPVIPFLMLLLVATLKHLEEKTKVYFVVPLYLTLIIGFFIIYYPIISGIPTSKPYVDTLKLFDSWYF